MTAPIRVLLIDDHTLFRSGVKALLSRQSEFEVVGGRRTVPRVSSGRWRCSRMWCCLT